MSKLYDLIIIGAGPAGITAGVYAARKMINFLVITKDIGGQTIWSGDIENYTGYQFISGLDLSTKFQEHMQKYNINVNEEEIISLKKADGKIVIKTKKNTYYSKTAIIASGKRSKELGVEGEEKFKNKGLTYCATCDGPIFSGKDVVVVGGGNSALEAVLGLVKIAKRIYVINNMNDFTGDTIMQDKIKGAGNVTVFNNTQVTSILGDKMVNAVNIEGKKGQETLEVEGIFVEIGLIPNSDFIEGINKNDLGEIIVDSYNRTNVEGIFAAGDVTDVPEKQIIIAAGEGSKAALTAFKYLIQGR